MPWRGQSTGFTSHSRNAEWETIKKSKNNNNENIFYDKPKETVNMKNIISVENIARKLPASKRK